MQFDTANLVESGFSLEICNKSIDKKNLDLLMGGFMTKEEYLNQLKMHLDALTQDELNEALQYYSDYFEEANDDQKVINELGTPEELAKIIIEKFANVPVKTEKETEETSQEEKKNDYEQEENLYFEFESKKVQKLVLNFGVADVVLISGNKYSLETRGVSSDSVNCYLSQDGVLTVNNNKRLNFNFWGHNRGSRIVPRFLVTIPENAHLNSLKIIIGAGNLRTKGCNISSQNVYFDVGAGNLVFGRIVSEKSNFRCGMGNLELSGELKGFTTIDCGMGAVKIDMNGNPSDYSYDVKLGLGDFKFNSEKRSGVCRVYNNEKKKNHFSVNCGMGSVVIKIK